MHVIRLRGPWDCQPLARVTLLAGGGLRVERADLPPGATLVMPADWSAVLGSDFRGLVRLIRRFATPTGIDGSTRVWLAIDNVDWQARVSLNNRDLGHIQLAGTTPSLPLALSPSLPLLSSPALPCPARFDITELLSSRNELIVEVLLPEVAAGVPPLPRAGRAGEPGGVIGLVRLEIEAP